MINAPGGYDVYTYCFPTLASIDNGSEIKAKKLENGFCSTQFLRIRTV
jgi:hypothetical protein